MGVDALRGRISWRRLRNGFGLLFDIATKPNLRNSWIMRLRPPVNAFQPHNDTAVNRYPEVFTLVGDELRGRAQPTVLSFGCSTGEEVRSLRYYLPDGKVIGMDVSRSNIARCRRSLRKWPDPNIEYIRAGSTERFADWSLDAIFCMAVFRHGNLSYSSVDTCVPHLDFAAFEATVSDLDRCLRPGGLLAIEHSNFRFGDTEVSRRYEVLLTFERQQSAQTPLFDRHNRRIVNGSYSDVVFQKKDVRDTIPLTLRGEPGLPVPKEP